MGNSSNKTTDLALILSRLDRMEEKFDTLDARIDSKIQSMEAKIEGKMDKMSADFIPRETLDERLTGQGKRIGAVEDDIASMKENKRWGSRMVISALVMAGLSVVTSIVVAVVLAVVL